LIRRISIYNLPKVLGCNANAASWNSPTIDPRFIQPKLPKNKKKRAYFDDPIKIVNLVKIKLLTSLFRFIFTIQFRNLKIKLFKIFGQDIIMILKFTLSNRMFSAVNFAKASMTLKE